MHAVNMKANDDDRYFWSQVSRWSRERGGHVRNSGLGVFKEQGTSGIDFAKYDAIPVSRSGPDSSGIAALDAFASLQKALPKFLSDNLMLPDRMGYNVPTPIQKHTIPISLDGHYDVMACAQTGSGKTVAYLDPESKPKPKPKPTPKPEPEPNLHLNLNCYPYPNPQGRISRASHFLHRFLDSRREEGKGRRWWRERTCRLPTDPGQAAGYGDGTDAGAGHPD